jgi:hypothetical protein
MGSYPSRSHLARSAEASLANARFIHFRPPIAADIAVAIHRIRQSLALRPSQLYPPVRATQTLRVRCDSSKAWMSRFRRAFGFCPDKGTGPGETHDCAHQ